MHSKFVELFVIFLFFGVSWAQISNSLDLDNLSKNPEVNDFGKKLEESGVNLPDLNKTKIDLEKIQNVLKEKCEKQNAGDAVDTLRSQQETMKDCVMQHLNATQLQEELEEAKKTGSMDEVFTKYCQKWPDAYACFDDATVTVRRCMSDKERKAFNRTLTIVQDFQEFMCHKDGDRLAMFVAEGGVECIQEQQEGVKECFNRTVGGRLPGEDDLSIATLPTFLFSDEDCQDFDKIRICVNKVLEKCSDTTPANIVDASFKYLKKQMPCDENVDEVALKAEATASEQQNAATSYSCLSFITLTLLLVLPRLH